MAKVVVTAKKDPEKATVALTTGLYESKQQSSFLAGMNVTHEILENNQQYEKAVSNLPDIAQNMPSAEVIEKGMKEIWARGIVDSYYKNTDLSINYSNRLNLKASENIKYDLSNGVNQYEQEVLSLLNYRMTNSIIDGYQCNGKNTVECARMSKSFSLALQNGNENTNKAVGIDMSFKQGSGLKESIRFDIPVAQRMPELTSEMVIKAVECGDEKTMECEIARGVLNNSTGNREIISEDSQRELMRCMTPGIETACDIYYAIKGSTFTGENLSWWQRGISAAAVIVPLGGSSIINKSDDIIEGVNDAKRVMNEADEITNGINSISKSVKVFDETDDFTTKVMKVKSYGLENGVNLSDHAVRNIIGRSNRGITIEKVIDTYKNGERYYNIELKQDVILGNGIALPLDKNGSNQVVTIIPEVTKGYISKLVKN